MDTVETTNSRMNGQEMEMAPVMPTERKRKWPDWTPDQQAILRLVKESYSRGKYVLWARAFAEHPEWREIILAGGRPFSHLWHSSASLREKGTATRIGQDRRVKVVKRKAWWKEQGKPHPMKAAMERKAEEAKKEAAMPAVDNINFCPKCGHMVAHYRQADKVVGRG